MGKAIHRKPPKRKQPRPRVDDDLIELAAALDARRVDKGAAGWFSVPWRDGWNAAWLALRAYDASPVLNEDPALRAVSTTLGHWLTKREESAEVYWAAGDLLDSITRGSPLLRAALRCVQSRISHSDGGGESYNAILRYAFDSLEVIPDVVEAAVIRWRMHDAINGVMHSSAPEQVKRENAFQIAWRRGLYRAAYAV